MRSIPRGSYNPSLFIFGFKSRREMPGDYDDDFEDFEDDFESDSGLVEQDAYYGSKVRVDRLSS
jgi:hypothetical protein